MSNHPNRNWRRRWTVDLDTREARHESGVVVRFVAGTARDGPTIEEWTADKPAEVRSSAKLLQEAADVYRRALAQRGVAARACPDCGYILSHTSDDGARYNFDCPQCGKTKLSDFVSIKVS